MQKYSDNSNRRSEAVVQILAAWDGFVIYEKDCIEFGGSQALTQPILLIFPGGVQRPYT